LGVKLIQSIEGKELALSMWINIDSMDLTTSNQAGLIAKLPAVVAVGNRSNPLPFSGIWTRLIKSDLLTIALQHLLREVLVDVGGLDYEGVCRVDVFLGLREWLLSGFIDSEQVKLRAITLVEE
jgi:hypothetical protein